MGNTLEAFTGESNEEAAAKSKDGRHGWRPGLSPGLDEGAELRFRGKGARHHLEPATLTTTPAHDWDRDAPPFLLPAQEEKRYHLGNSVGEVDAGAKKKIDELGECPSETEDGNRNLLHPVVDSTRNAESSAPEADHTQSSSSFLSDVTDYNVGTDNLNGVLDRGWNVSNQSETINNLLNEESVNPSPNDLKNDYQEGELDSDDCSVQGRETGNGVCESLNQDVGFATDNALIPQESLGSCDSVGEEKGLVATTYLTHNNEINEWELKNEESHLPSGEDLKTVYEAIDSQVHGLEGRRSVGSISPGSDTGPGNLPDEVVDDERSACDSCDERANDCNDGQADDCSEEISIDDYAFNCSRFDVETLAVDARPISTVGESKAHSSFGGVVTDETTQAVPVNRLNAIFSYLDEVDESFQTDFDSDPEGEIDSGEVDSGEASDDDRRHEQTQHIPPQDTQIGSDPLGSTEIVALGSNEAVSQGRNETAPQGSSETISSPGIKNVSLGSSEMVSLGSTETGNREVNEFEEIQPNSSLESSPHDSNIPEAHCDKDEAIIVQANNQSSTNAFPDSTLNSVAANLGEFDAEDRKGEDDGVCAVSPVEAVVCVNNDPLRDSDYEVEDVIYSHFTTASCESNIDPTLTIPAFSPKSPDLGIGICQAFAIDSFPSTLSTRESNEEDEITFIPSAIGIDQMSVKGGEIVAEIASSVSDQSECHSVDKEQIEIFDAVDESEESLIESCLNSHLDQVEHAPKDDFKESVENDEISTAFQVADSRRYDEDADQQSCCETVSADCETLSPDLTATGPSSEIELFSLFSNYSETATLTQPQCPFDGVKGEDLSFSHAPVSGVMVEAFVSQVSVDNAFGPTSVEPEPTSVEPGTYLKDQMDTRELKLERASGEIAQAPGCIHEFAEGTEDGSVCTTMRPEEPQTEVTAMGIELIEGDPAVVNENSIVGHSVMYLSLPDKAPDVIDSVADAAETGRVNEDELECPMTDDLEGAAIGHDAAFSCIKYPTILQPQENLPYGSISATKSVTLVPTDFPPCELSSEYNENNGLEEEYAAGGYIVICDDNERVSEVVPVHFSTYHEDANDAAIVPTDERQNQQFFLNGDAQYQDLTSDCHVHAEKAGIDDSHSDLKMESVSLHLASDHVNAAGTEKTCMDNILKMDSQAFQPESSIYYANIPVIERSETSRLVNNPEGSNHEYGSSLNEPGYQDWMDQPMNVSSTAAPNSGMVTTSVIEIPSSTVQTFSTCDIFQEAPNLSNENSEVVGGAAFTQSNQSSALYPGIEKPSTAETFDNFSAPSSLPDFNERLVQKIPPFSLPLTSQSLTSHSLHGIPETSENEALHPRNLQHLSAHSSHNHLGSSSAHLHLSYYGEPQPYVPPAIATDCKLEECSYLEFSDTGCLAQLSPTTHYPSNTADESNCNRMTNLHLSDYGRSFDGDYPCDDSYGEDGPRLSPSFHHDDARLHEQLPLEISGIAELRQDEDSYPPSSQTASSDLYDAQRQPRLGPEGKNTSLDPSPAPLSRWDYERRDDGGEEDREKRDEEEEEEEEENAESDSMNKTGDSGCDAEVGEYLGSDDRKANKSWKSTNDLRHVPQKTNSGSRRHRNSRKDEVRKAERIDGRPEEETRNVSLRRHVLRKAASTCLPAFPCDESPIRHRGVGQSPSELDSEDATRDSTRRKKEKRRRRRRDDRERTGKGENRELEDYITYYRRYYRTYYPDWYHQYFRQYEDYLRGSYSSQRADSAFGSYQAWSPEDYFASQYQQHHHHHPHQLGSPYSSMTPFVPMTNPLPYGAAQYDAGYGWANWFQSSVQHCVPHKFGSALPCLQFSGLGLTMSSVKDKARTVTIFQLARDRAAQSPFLAFPSPLAQIRPSKKQLVSFCRRIIGKLEDELIPDDRSFEISADAGGGDSPTKKSGGRRRRKRAESKREEEEEEPPKNPNMKGEGGGEYQVDARESSTGGKRRSEKRNHRDDRELVGRKLLWELMELLLKQNGKIVGSDIADLLLDDHDGDDDGSDCSSNSASGYRSSVSDVDEPAESAAVIRHFRNLLERGKMPEAIDWAFSNKKEGHGLYLTMMLDSVVPGSHVSSALQRLERELAPGDSLLTLYYLLTGRQPPICVKVADPRLRRWRHHLAIAVANLTDDTQHHDSLNRFLMHFAESLLVSDSLAASHLCHLLIVWCTSSLPSAPLPLIAHAVFPADAKSEETTTTTNDSTSRSKSAAWNAPSNEIIQLTELHEYLISQFDPTGASNHDRVDDDGALSLRPIDPPVNADDDLFVSPRDNHLPTPYKTLHHHSTLHRGFLPYKLLYAQRLLEAGLPKQALNYCVELLFRCFRSNKPRNSLTVGVLERQIESLTSKVLLEDRGFYASYVLRKNSFSNAFQTWKTELLRQSHLD